MKLYPRDFGSLVLIPMLYVAHDQEIVSVKPPEAVMKVLSFIGRLIGYDLPP